MEKKIFVPLISRCIDGQASVAEKVIKADGLGDEPDAVEVWVEPKGSDQNQEKLFTGCGSFPEDGKFISEGICVIVRDPW